MASPPTTRRLRSASVVDERVEDLVEAVVARLTTAGLVAGPAAPGGPPVATIKSECGCDVSPTADQQRLWIRELRRQLDESPNFGTREREEVRGLLVIGEGTGAPQEHQAWFWGRVRLFIIVAHHGWGAAVADSKTSSMERLGIRLSAAAALPGAAARPAAAPPAPWRGRPSRPSGLRRPPSGGAAAAAAAPPSSKN